MDEHGERNGVHLECPANLAAPPTLSGLPAGAGYTYVPATGVVSLTGMPTTLAAGAALNRSA